MIASRASVYRKTQVSTASPIQLVVQLYEGAVRFTQQGIQAIEARDTLGAHDALLRSQAIIVELQATLNPDAGEVARTLELVYRGIYSRLVRANVEKSAAPAREALGFLRELLDGWRQVEATAATDPVGGTTMIATVGGGS